MNQNQELVKSCIIDIIKDSQFLRVLREIIAAEVERVFSEKVNRMEEQVIALEEENRRLLEKCESIEQYSRRSNIRINGLQQGTEKDMEKRVLKFFQDKLEVDVPSENVDRCHHVGKPKDGRQGIIVRFSNYKCRQLVITKRRLLKGTGITVTEDLTSSRYKLYRYAVAKFDMRSVWTSDGNVTVCIKNKKHRVFSETDVDSLLEAAG